MAFYTYITSSKRNGTLYVGSTDDLRVRIFDHKEGSRPGFTKRYKVSLLVWFEVHETRDAAKTRERQIKEWQRAWKLRLIEGENPHCDDLYEKLNDLLPFERPLIRGPRRRPGPRAQLNGLLKAVPLRLQTRSSGSRPAPGNSDINVEPRSGP